MKADHIVILVSDLDAGLRHYGALLPLLGLQKTVDHVWKTPDGFAIGLQQATAEGAFNRNAAGIHHFCLSVESDQVLDDIARRMRNAGMMVPEFSHFNTARSLFIDNPDGFQLEISFDPGAQT